MLDMTVDRDDMDGEGQFDPLRKFMIDHYSAPSDDVRPAGWMPAGANLTGRGHGPVRISRLESAARLV